MRLESQPGQGAVHMALSLLSDRDTKVLVSREGPLCACLASPLRRELYNMT